MIYPQLSGKKIYIAGHNGMVGSAIARLLSSDDSIELLTASHNQVDLTRQAAVEAFMSANKPDLVIIAAAKVGGIHANNHYPAEFIYQNLMIEANLIQAAFTNKVEKLLFLGSSCIYPKMAKQPIAETELLQGTLEPTNEPYAIAKIAGIKLCESYNRQYGTDYRSVMPTNLYGPGDNFHPENSHVIPGLIRRFHQAKKDGDETVSIWGTGQARREFLHVDDMAAACLHVFNLEKTVLEQITKPMESHINVGCGEDISIKTLAESIRDIVYPGVKLEFDTSKSDGTPKKQLDTSKIRSTGWAPKTSLTEGLEETYQWYCLNLT